LNEVVLILEVTINTASQYKLGGGTCCAGDAVKYPVSNLILSAIKSKCHRR
jgi:hypothetical protein